MDRHSSNLSKPYRTWHLKWFRDFLDNEAQLLLATPPGSERNMDIEEACDEVCFQYGKTSHLDKLLGKRISNFVSTENEKLCDMYISPLV